MNPLADLNSLSLDDLYAELSDSGLVERLFRLAYDEDLVGQHASGDITSISWGADDENIKASLVLRERATVAGLSAIPDLCAVFAPDAQVEFEARDSGTLDPGASLATVSGPASQVLCLERPMLNLISRLSGVASLTRKYADLAAPVHVLDTRKTTPGLRVLEKYAVRCGGGRTHRMGLHDAVLLKDNHLASCSLDDLANRVRAASERAHGDRALRFVQVEVDSLEQFAHLLTLPEGVIDIVLLDNMPAHVLRRAVEMRNGSAPAMQLEASGGISLETIAVIAASGVDRISVGALTHSAVSVDIGLDAIG